MNERLRAFVGANVSEFRRKMAEVQKIARSIPNRIMIEAKARTEKAQNKLNRIAQTMMSVQAVASNFALGSLASVSPAAIPILAATAGGLGALVTYLGMAGGAALAFGAVAIPTITKLFDETTKLTSAQKAAKGEFTKVGNTWKGITKDLEKPVLEAFSKSMQFVNKTLQMARPLFDSSAKAVNNLLNSLNKSMDSTPVKAFFDYLNKQGGPMLETFGKTIGNFVQGIMSMMVAFGPLSESFSQGFLKMSQNFAKWAAGLSESEKFKSFISYVQTNGPKVLSLIGNFTNLLINLGVGMAPLGQQILDIVNSFLNWSNTMMAANPEIAKFIGYGIVIGGILRALTPLVLTASAFFAGFGKTLIGVGGKIVSFLMPILSKIGANIVRLGATFMANAVRIAAGWVVAMGPVGWVIAAVVGLVALIIANWDKVKEWTSKIWSAVTDFVMKAVAGMIKIASQFVLNLVKGWRTLQTGTSQIMKSIGNTIQNIWNGIKAFFLNILSNLLSTAQNIFGSIVRAITSKMNEALGVIENIGQGILNFFGGINLFDSGKAIIQSAIDGLISMKGKIMGKVEEIVGAVRDFWPFSPAKKGPMREGDEESKKNAKESVSLIEKLSNVDIFKGIESKVVIA